MILIGLCPSWREFYSNSPFYAILTAPLHPRFTLVELKTQEDCQTLKELSKSAEAVLVDDAGIGAIGNSAKCLKLFLTGDLHAFTPSDLVAREASLAWCDYALSTCAFCLGQKTPYPYHWPRKALMEEKPIFFPHCIPAWVQPEVVHKFNVGLGGETSPIVYPFRAMCEKFPEVARIPYLKKKRADFFEVLSNYRVGITCNSFIKYNIAKYVEIPWSGSLLFAPAPPAQEMEFLGFDESNSVLIPEWASRDRELVRNKLLEVLGSWHEHYAAVAMAGRELALKQHTVTQRLYYILNLVDRINRGGFKREDALTAFLEVA